MTAPEIREIDRKMVVVVPVGSTEQHGPHLPVNTDAQLVTAVAEELERRERVLLAPTVWLGHSPHHLSFGGTLSGSHEMVAQNLTAIASCFFNMGFQNLLFLNGHGGNQLPVNMALQSLKIAFPDRKCWAASYWQFAASEIQRLRTSEYGGMGHACELETSLTMYLFPETVRLEKIRDAGEMNSNPWLRNEMFLASVVSQVQNFEEFTDTGAFGAPSQASPEKGCAFFEAILAGLTGFIQSVQPVPNSEKLMRS